MLNDKITNGVTPSEKDALWASSVLVATLAFATIEAGSPEEAWPLTPSSTADLDWLKLIEGKKEIWKIANPHRTDSIFYQRVRKFEPHITSLSALEVDLSTLPTELLDICHINNTSTTENNRYLLLASTLAKLVGIVCTPETFGIYIGFFGSMGPDFKILLTQKDPAALIMLASWYASVCHLKQWWLWPRVNLERRAICMYLRLFHADNQRIMTLVRGIEALSEQAASAPWQV